MSVPKIYVAITAVTAEFARSGVAKTKVNQAENYFYRGIDDICSRLAPLLAHHRLCVLPRVLDRICEERSSADGSVLMRIALRVAFDLVSARDGSVHSIETYGEALDAGDKATAKAMTAAYKQALVQAFCIPVEGNEDADAATHRVASGTDKVLDPEQGWHQWASDIQDMVRVCETIEALDRVQATYRGLLRAASKREPDLYAAIGTAMQARRRTLLARPVSASHPADGLLAAAEVYAETVSA
jgi:hypothetical protein